MTRCAHIQTQPRCLLYITLSVCLIRSVGTGEDQVESASVIPIAKTSQEQVGSPITVRVLQAGSSRSQVKKLAVDEFPLDLMSPVSRRTATEIIQDLSLFRRLPQIELEADRRCYEFFTSHPDMAVSIWRAMEISQVVMTRKSATTFETDTRDGTSGVVKVLLNTSEHYVVTCQGEFKSPAIKKPIQATAMMHLSPTFHPNGTITHRLDMYVSFESAAIEAIARFISPISNRIADRNFEEISLFVKMMSMAMEQQPGWVEQLTRKIEGVPVADIDELLKLTATLYVDKVKAENSVSGEQVPLNAVLPPTQTAALTD